MSYLRGPLSLSLVFSLLFSHSLILNHFWSLLLIDNSLICSPLSSLNSPLAGLFSLPLSKYNEEFSHLDRSSWAQLVHS